MDKQSLDFLRKYINNSSHIHTPVEMVCIEDIDHTIQLIYALLQKIDPENINLQNTFD